MNPPDKHDQELLRGELKKRLKRFLVGTLTLVIGIWVAYITQIVIGNLTSTTEIEYKISRYRLSEWLPQNISEVAPLKLGDYPLKDSEFVTIQLWNRTSSNLDRTAVRIDTNDGNVVPFHKVILYSNSLDRDWVEWANPGDNKILEFSVAFLNKNWSTNPNVSVRFFYVSGAPKEISLKTNKPGINFIKFDEAKSYWWLFGLEGPLIAAGAVLALIIILVVTWKLGDWMTQRQYIGFARVLAKGIAANSHGMAPKDVEKFYWLATRLYIYSTKRVLWKEKNDPELKIPEHIGNEEKKPLSEDQKT